MSFNHRNGPGLAKRLVMFAVRLLLHNKVGIAVGGATRVLYPRNGNDWVDVTQVQMTLPRLAPTFDAYRLVQISDFHLGTWLSYTQLEHAIDLVNQQQPDVVAITGDFVSYHAKHYYDDLVKALGKIQARDGIVAILGNHDHWSDPFVIRQVLAQTGIIDLSNDVHTLIRGNDCLHLCGVDDYMTANDHLGSVLSQLPEQGAAILLAHEPDFADISGSTGRFDLQISGHSHGGQIVFPWIGSPFLPGYARKYPSGAYQVNGMKLYTNRGLGTAEFQVRWNCRPEITAFTLHCV